MGKYQLNQTGSFDINVRGADGQLKKGGGDKFDISILGPNDTDYPSRVRDMGNGEYTVTFTPAKVGKIVVDVKLGGEPIKGSPYTTVALPGMSKIFFQKLT